ncbi:hypothetical protein MHUMG1_07643 [Metarhizium humberi]|uniref:C6 zinc finger domain protein n=1 Tax=Metarhizium humberi TaxID=2596975 RepID=A0A9P8M6H5_9HYPO|nr:hypothetical protein MHUMG1_07643 [Metarhizium humberi]
MADVNSNVASPAKPRKRRIPAKCDGRRPCSRCRSLRKVCKFEERPKESHELRIDELQKQVEDLQTKIRQQEEAITSVEARSGHAISTSFASLDRHPFGTYEAVEPIVAASPESSRAGASLKSGTRSSIEQVSPLRAERSTVPFRINLVETPDVVVAGLTTLDQACSYFLTFFQGCDRYVPVFDPQYDSMESVRSRSSILFSAICTVGCRALTGTDSQQWRLLNFHLRRTINAAISVPAMLSLETIQALLVRACYTSERSLLVAAATRMAVDLGLPNAYDSLMSRVLSASWGPASDASVQDESILMRKTRTWLHILNMSHILHVDAGDFLALGFNGDARRSRVLLKKPLMRKQDMCLWPQVELNALRTQMYSRLCNRIHTDAEIMDIVSDAMLDINVWYDDWNRIFDPKDPHSPWLLLNMQVQRCWGVTMALCRAIRTTGVENVDVMSPTQKQMLAMAQEALWQHLGIITQEPRLYLQNLRFAMDFVWAKCVFCYLLLLKLTMLLPNEASRSGNDLIDRGHILLSELGEAGGGLLNGHRSNTGKVYLQLLETGIDKFSSAIGNGRRNHTDAIRNPAPNNGSILQIEEGQDSFVPEQFVFDWDFPGLTLFSSSVTDTGWLDDILLEALNGTDEFMGFGWSTTDTTN